MSNDMYDGVLKAIEKNQQREISSGTITSVNTDSLSVVLDGAKRAMTVQKPASFYGARGDTCTLARNPRTLQWEVVEVKGNGAAAATVMTGARVYKTTNTTSPSASTWWAVTFNSVIDDDGGYWDAAAPSRLTIPDDGVYLMGANMQWNSNSNTDAFRRLGAIWLNGTSILTYGDGMIVSQPISINMTTRRRCVAGDYIELMAWSNIPNLVLLSSGATHQYSPVLWIERLR